MNAEFSRLPGAFEIDNARNLTTKEIVDTFVPTRSFWRILTAKNHIVLGARGSGKTVLARMLSHDHLAQFHHAEAKKIIHSRQLIGIYVPTRLEWVGGLKNKPWQTPAEQERSFQWRLNLSCCAALLKTIRSCLDVYIRDGIQRARLELALVQQLVHAWFVEDLNVGTLQELATRLEDVEYAKQVQVTKERILGTASLTGEPIGMSFDQPLFTPLRRAITLTGRILELPATVAWMLCLDEAEFLDPLHHRILNSHLRAHSGNLVFKITTMPYFHKTLETNTSVSLNVGHDFEYVYIDRDPITAGPAGDDSGLHFATQLIEKRARVYGENLDWTTVENLLGRSRLLDPKASGWSEHSKMMGLLKRYASPQTVERAHRLAGTKEFKDQISRKMHSALLLRERLAHLKGRSELDLYSGTAVAIRCSDANPRRLIRILNSFFVRANKKEGRGFMSLSPKRQTTILTHFSSSTLTRVQSEPLYGRSLYALIHRIGTFMSGELHRKPLTTDQFSSVAIDSTIDDETWETLKLAVSLGLLFPNITPNPEGSDQMPERTGAFHMAYVLAPYFRTLPRRGRAIPLKAVLRSTGTRRQDHHPSQLQLTIFDLNGG